MTITYRVFARDFIDAQRYFDNLEIVWDTRKLDGLHDEGFWHLITKTDKITHDRIPDYRRSERLPWCGPTISHFSDPIVKCWNYKKGSRRIRTYLWLEAWDYVIILEKKRKQAFLVTAFHVDGDSTHRSLSRKYAQRIP
jgi:hypothetical protein